MGIDAKRVCSYADDTILFKDSAVEIASTETRITRVPTYSCEAGQKGPLLLRALLQISQRVGHTL